MKLLVTGGAGYVGGVCATVLVERGHEADLCTVDPGYDVDLYVSTDLRTLTELWLGYSDWPRALHSGAPFVLRAENPHPATRLLRVQGKGRTTPAPRLTALWQRP